MRSLSRLGLGAVTTLTMAIATFPLIVFSVLASSLIEEFSITRSQVGFLVTATGLVGALTSPYLGRLTDRIGAVNATIGALATGAVTLLALAVAPVYAVLLPAALAAGVSNGWGNPSTNALIFDSIPAGSRAFITGIKQSGVQIGTFLGGLLLPVFAGFWGWRYAVGSFLVLPMGALLWVWGAEDSPHRVVHADWGSVRVPTSVKWIAVYGALSGLATSAMISFLPLFAEEDQMWSAQAAGSLIAIVGFVGVIARIGWPTATERWLGHGRTLGLLSVLTTGSAVVLGLAALDVFPSWVLAPAAVFLAVGAVAWNSVGMLAVMDLSEPGLVGKGTGVVLLGFLLGYAAGAPLMGWSVDVLGSYAPGWFGCGALLVVSVLTAGKITRTGTLARS